ncbi:MAG: hypothetical protein IMY85_07270 [Chloroflexi bacterium]|nr:hypothetical protein [Chloroflexota bacterium]
MDDLVGRGVAEMTGRGVGLGLGVFVGGGNGLGDGVLVAGIGAVDVGDICVGIGVLVALIPGVEVGIGVSGGLIVQVGVEVAWVVGNGVADCPGPLVAVALSKLFAVGVSVKEISPMKDKVGVGVGDGSLGVIIAISGNPPVSRGSSIPSKSWMISRPIAGTGRVISSTP